ncbi:MAG: acyl carrier protein [Bacteroidales bacterium]|jgi:acyl carrier protein|nr:acyl carrier protein [Bacteroidales bacterium]
MDNFIEQIAEILEVDTVTTNDVLTEFEAWDSLAVLSIIALADEYYGVTLSAAEVRNAKTVGGVKDIIESKK